MSCRPYTVLIQSFNDILGPAEPIIGAETAPFSATAALISSFRTCRDARANLNAYFAAPTAAETSALLFKPGGGSTGRVRAVIGNPALPAAIQQATDRPLTLANRERLKPFITSDSLNVYRRKSNERNIPKSRGLLGSGRNLKTPRSFKEARPSGLRRGIGCCRSGIL